MLLFVGLAVVALSYLVPERAAIFSSTWFAILLAVFVLVLTVSLVQQVHTAWKRTFRPKTPVASGVAVQVDPGILDHALARAFYLRMPSAEGDRRVKHPFGYWGAVLLHLGLILTVGGALLVTVTESTALVHLVEGETFEPGQEWGLEVWGPLGDPIDLEEAITLAQVRPEYWPNDEPKQISSDVTFVDASGVEASTTLAVNEIHDRGGLRFYQSQRFGHAFFVIIAGADGYEARELLEFENPPYRDEPSYADYTIDGVAALVQGKYFADAEQRSMDGEPLLVLRLKDADGTVSEELELTAGESGQLGDYEVELLEVRRWSEIVVVDQTGLPLLFVGFFVIFAGSLLIYLAPPREAWVLHRDGSDRFFWRAARFRQFYDDERERLERTVRGEDQDGPPETEAVRPDEEGS